MIQYLRRSYDAIIEALMSSFRQKLPEMTDTTLSNPLVMLLHIIASALEQVHYYIDDTATESFWQKARRFKSMVNHARQAGYRIKLSQPAKVELKITLNEELTAPFNLFNVLVTSPEANIGFLIDSGQVIPPATKTISVSATQAIPAPDPISVTSVGGPWQAYTIPSDIADTMISVVINGEVWNMVDNLGFARYDDKYFTTTISTGSVQSPIILFGDGVCGAMPNQGDVIEIYYYQTLGFDGNMAAGTLTEIASGDMPTVFKSITNLQNAVGGRFIETTDEIRSGIRTIKRTLGTAVTKRDIIDLAESVNGIAKAGLKSQAGRPIEVYVLPDNGVVATQSLIDDVKEFLDSYRVLGREIVVKSAGVIMMQLQIDVRRSGQFTEEYIDDIIRPKLLDKYSPLNSQIEGTAYLSDIYEIVESVQGVASSEVKVMQYKPYARNESNLQLDFSCTVDIAANKGYEWKIIYNTSDVFSLYRDGLFCGMYSVGQQYVFDVITFTVNSSYDSGTEFIFFTYKGFGSIELKEQSVIILTNQNLSINYI